jgi:hypothetical protein
MQLRNFSLDVKSKRKIAICLIVLERMSDRDLICFVHAEFHLWENGK